MMNISQNIRHDWNQRIELDPLYWMSEAYDSKEAMLESGKRDLDQLLKGIDGLGDKRVLEYGCGIGRLAYHLEAALLTCVDVSYISLQHAQKLLCDKAHIELLCIEGSGVSFLQDASHYLVYSHAVLSHIPRSLVGTVLLDLVRVVEVKGRLRLQLYLGKQGAVLDGRDTLGVRGYEASCLKEAFDAAGCELIEIRDLLLPFDASCDGLQPVILDIEKHEMTRVSEKRFSKLLHGGTIELHEPGSKVQRPLEVAMLSHRVKDCVVKGELSQAQATLQLLKQKTSCPQELAEIEKILFAIKN